MSCCWPREISTSTTTAEEEAPTSRPSTAAEIVPITPAISQRASALIDELALSHGLRLADALIGATAIEHQAMLLTANLRHFSAIEGLLIEAFSP